MFEKVEDVTTCEDIKWFNKGSAPDLNWWFNYIIYYDSKQPHLAKREKLWIGAVEV